MPNFNKVILAGNLTRDPEIKYTPKGTAISDISLAVNRTYSTDSGEKREEVTFVDITLWGRTAEIVGEYCKKGRPLLVEGRLHMDTWDDKATGQRRSKLKVIGENIQLLGSGNGQGGYVPNDSDDPRDHSRGQSTPRPPARPPAKPHDPDLDQPEDDIPF